MQHVNGKVLGLVLVISFAVGTLRLAAADMSAREVVSVLFQASEGAPVDWSGKDLSNLDLSDVDFKAARLTRVNFQGSDLTRADLSGVLLPFSRLDRATLIGANFSGADLTDASLLRPNLYADMTSAGVNLPRFNGAIMVRAHLNGRFDGVDFRGANLREAFFGPRDPRTEELISPMMEMRGCDFSEAQMQGVDLSRNALQTTKFIGADVSGANFRHSNLSGADFSGANIAGADFTDTIIDGARFANVRGRDSAIGLASASYDP